MSTYSVFAQRLRKLRIEANMNQQDVAEKLEIQRSAYTKYETDRACPDSNRLLMLADLYNVSVDYLLGRDENLYDAWRLQDGLSEIMLDEQELYLLTIFRRLTEEQQMEIVDQARHCYREKDNR